MKIKDKMQRLDLVRRSRDVVLVIFFIISAPKHTFDRAFVIFGVISNNSL